ncbi:DUF6146 family protein [Carboxylicivirga caseinilyticus]|uniref:DUF6146 family protein n=1 Tax=Carboxylicivirga caseinilyticus TaxID=3417572 RepID=UPI003D34D022|nr:hypothetical protein [Marinilabiliaceae bacterium A049]
MKKYFFIILVIGVIVACSTTKDIQNQSKAEIELAADSTEYELIVLDPRFESYLISQPYSKEFYSNEYYKQWNLQYCTEWNIRHANPFRYGDFYETNIPYESNTDYGIDFNFRLYHYFQFIEKEYGIVLIARRGQAVR